MSSSASTPLAAASSSSSGKTTKRPRSRFMEKPSTRLRTPFDVIWSILLYYDGVISAHMMTSWEKTLILSLMFIVAALICHGVFFYFPRHIAAIVPRIVYYITGGVKDGSAGALGNEAKQAAAAHLKTGL